MGDIADTVIPDWEPEEVMVEICGRLVHETEMAILVEVDEKEYWLPKSAIEMPTDYEVGEEITNSVPEKLAYDKGLV